MPKSPDESTESSNAVIEQRLNAVERAFHLHSKLLIGWLTKKFGDETTAKDVAQDAFLRVWRAAHKREIEDPRALIFKTAANLAANEFNARKRFLANHIDPATMGVNETIETVPADEPSPERIASARQDYKTCMQVIRTLPEKVRLAFVKSRFEARTYREIAEELQVSESSVEKYIITALKGLRAAIATPDESARVVRLSPHIRKPSYSSKQSRAKTKI